MIYLSHSLSINTPAYAGGQGIEIKEMKSICNGDSCNQLYISMPNHIGTHVDVPAHFVEGGKTITDYAADDWVFNRCCLIDIPCEAGQIINAEEVRANNPDYDCELLIIRTGFERYRNKDLYWQKSPVFHNDLGEFFENNFVSLTAIAFDCISLSSLCDRDIGRIAHKEILERDIRIFEDVSLLKVKGDLDTVWCFPLMLSKSDGAPVTMLAAFVGG